MFYVGSVYRCGNLYIILINLRIGQGVLFLLLFFLYFKGEMDAANRCTCSIFLVFRLMLIHVFFSRANQSQTR